MHGAMRADAYSPARLHRKHDPCASEPSIFGKPLMPTKGPLPSPGKLKGEQSAASRGWAAAAIFTTLRLSSLDPAIANIEFPTIASDLHSSPADVIWVVNVYQIALVSTLLPL